MSRHCALLLLAPLAALAVACSSDETASDSPEPAGTTVTTVAPTSPTSASTAAAGTTDVTADRPFPPARCAANELAGTITYLSSFDFAASASIVEVLVAKQKGYFDELCLDVEVKPSFSVENYPADRREQRAVLLWRVVQ